MNPDLHDGHPRDPARGLITAAGLAILFFWLPLGVALLAILWPF